MAGIPSDLLDLLLQGESETLEFKSAVHEPAVLARLISAFANTHGGTILVGVAEPPEVIGINIKRFNKVYEAALRRLEPQEVAIDLRMLDGGEGYTVAAIDVKKSPQPVLASGSAFKRIGSLTRPLQWTKLVQQEPARQAPVTLETLAQALDKQSDNFEQLLADNKELKEELKAANSPEAKQKERFYGFVYGIAASLVAALLLWVGAKVLPS